MMAGGLLLLGWVKKLRGVRGELSVSTRSEGLERYLGLRRAWFALPGGEARPQEIDTVRVHAGRLLVKPAGVDSAADAAAWIGREMWVEESALPPLEPGSYYAHQLVGLEVVTRDGEVLGHVSDVRSTGGCDLWVVRRRSGEELLIPAAAAICTRVDVQGGRITVDPPAGLLELNAI
jgi:16S rRNA processing protein RimM